MNVLSTWICVPGRVPEHILSVILPLKVCSSCAASQRTDLDTGSKSDDRLLLGRCKYGTLVGYCGGSLLVKFGGNAVLLPSREDEYSGAHHRCAWITGNSDVTPLS
jgi:hypothetical protein